MKKLFCVILTSDANSQIELDGPIVVHVQTTSRDRAIELAKEEQCNSGLPKEVVDNELEISCFEIKDSDIVID
jgi:hypothetical protein